MDDTDTINSFCAAEKISRSQFYKLQREGRGPRLFYVGTHARISADARREWRQMLEAEAAAKKGGAQ